MERFVTLALMVLILSVTGVKDYSPWSQGYALSSLKPQAFVSGNLNLKSNKKKKMEFLTNIALVHEIHGLGTFSLFSGAMALTQGLTHGRQAVTLSATPLAAGTIISATWSTV